MKRSEAFGMLGGILHEFTASRFALGRALHQAASDPTILAKVKALAPSHLKRAEEHVEVTYMLRLFAEFEAVTMGYWQTIRRSGRLRWTPMELMIDRVAARQYVDTTVLQRAHEVCKYRNDIVHHRLRHPRITIRECESRLATFLSYLPQAW